MPRQEKPRAEGDERWLLAPSVTNLGRVWVTVLFAVLTVIGVVIVTVLGIKAGDDRVTRVERGQVAAEAAILLGRAVVALQDERGLAELWRADPSEEARELYVGAQSATDTSLALLRSGWQIRRSVLDELGPPTLSDLDEGVAPLADLRDTHLTTRERSTVEAYAGMIDVLASGARRLEGVASDAALAPRVRALVRILEAGEALAHQRDVLVSSFADGTPIREEELVKLLLLQQAARTNLSSIRGLGLPEIGAEVSELFIAMTSDDAQRLLMEVQAGNEIELIAWFGASSRRLESVRSLVARVENDLTSIGVERRESAERTSAISAIGLVGLLAVSGLAGAAAIGVARHRAQALDELGDLAKGLFEWFEPERLAKVGGVIVAGRYDAASEYTRAGGDWYDVYSTGEDRVVVTIGDVAGHGASATAQMAQVRNLLRGITLASAGQSPAGQMAQLEGALRGSGTMATIFHGVLDLAGGEFRYTRAGHLPGLIRQGDSVAALDEALGSPLGAESDQRYEDAIVALTIPWQIVLFTDGLIEMRDADVEFGIGMVAGRVASGDCVPDQLADELIDARPSTLDDAALLVLGIEEVSPESAGISDEEE
ncbi:MAG: SpoIIE family protein phosphatase [Acidimicrobiia bacterium]